MTHESNAPVIVGAGVAQQRFDDPSLGVEAATLMQQALEAAADDSGSLAILHAAEALLMPRGTWLYTNPGPVVAPWNPALRTTVAEIGVLQQTLLSRACTMISEGSAQVVLVCGGETKHRALRGLITGIPTFESPTSGSPDVSLKPADDFFAPEELERGLVTPARQYAMIDTALRFAQGLSAAEHVELLADMWSGFNDVAVSNPDAWSRAKVERNTFIDAPTTNQMHAWPYTKLHCAQWNVDQAAALIICSASTAQRFGIARDRWVFAHLGVESNLMVPLTQRLHMHRSPATRVAGEALLAHGGVAAADFEHVDIYSCFPAAVRVQLAELNIAQDRQLTVTGGMTFSGGPLNNYTLQATAAMTHVLREDPSAAGMVTNISGLLTKYGASKWSCTPPAQPFAALDVSADAAAATETVEVEADYAGPARVITYTVAFDKGVPTRGIAIAESADGRRCVATTTDSDLIADMLTNDWCDRSIAADAALLRG